MKAKPFTELRVDQEQMIMMAYVFAQVHIEAGMDKRIATKIRERMVQSIKDDKLKLEPKSRFKP